jgi:hypothetical protein
MVLIWDLVKPLVTWTPAQRERRLFHVCCQVQAQLMATYPGYQTTNQHTVPDAVVDEVKEMLGALLSQTG